MIEHSSEIANRNTHPVKEEIPRQTAATGGGGNYAQLTAYHTFNWFRLGAADRRRRRRLEHQKSQVPPSARQPGPLVRRAIKPNTIRQSIIIK